MGGPDTGERRADFASEDKLTTRVQEYHTTVSETAGPGIEINAVDEGTSRAAVLRQSDAALGTVVENRVLTAPGAPEKRHIGEDVARGGGVQSLTSVHRTRAAGRHDIAFGRLSRHVSCLRTGF